MKDNADKTEIIIANKLFDNITQDVIEKSILPYGRTKNYEKNSNVFMTQDKVDMVHILLSGKIKLVYYLENGEEDVGNMILPPKLVGIDLVCTRTQLSPYQATAVEKSSIFSFPSKIILEPGTMPEKERLTCIRNLLLIISHVNMQNEYRLAILVCSSLRDRIMVYLSMQANKAQSATFSIPFSREEMAAFLRVNRSALSHELSLLRQEGIIDFYKNRFTVLKNDMQM